MFRDNYTDFSFDDIHSSNFKVWITNKNDLQRSMSPNFSDKFNSPTYSQIRYYEGTTIDKQDFKLSCAAIDVTLNEWRAICEWLSPLKSGKLRFDWNDKYYYMVKISKAPSGTMFMRSKIDNIMGQLYVVEFTLEFTTMYDWAAIGPQAWYESSGDNSGSLMVSCYNNSYYMPTIVVPGEEDSDGYYKIDLKEGESWETGNTLTFGLRDGGNYYLEFGLDDDRVVVRYYYNTTESENDKKIIGHNVVNTKNVNFPVYLSTLVWTYIDGSDKYFSKVWTTDQSTQNFLFANTGVFKMYPRFTFSQNATLYNSVDEILYKFNFQQSNNATSFLYTDVDFRTGTITFNNQPITETYYNMAEDEYYNCGSYGIESGRPELWKVVVGDYKYEAAKTDENGNVTTPPKAEILLLLNNKPIYSRNKPFLLHLFTKDLVQETNVFNETQYDKGNYSYDSSNLGKRKLFYCPDYTVQYGQDDYSCWSIKIDLAQDGLSSYSSLELVGNSFSKFEQLYISICDCEQISYTTEGNILVGCYPRDVI